MIDGILCFNFRLEQTGAIQYEFCMISQAFLSVLFFIFFILLRLRITKKQRTLEYKTIIFVILDEKSDLLIYLIILHHNFLNIELCFSVIVCFESNVSI